MATTDTIYRAYDAQGRALYTILYEDGEHSSTLPFAMFAEHLRLMIFQAVEAGTVITVS